MLQQLALNVMRLGLFSYVLTSIAFSIWSYVSTKDRGLVVLLFVNENYKNRRLNRSQSFLLRAVRISRFTVIAGGVVWAGIMFLQLTMA